MITHNLKLKLNLMKKLLLVAVLGLISLAAQPAKAQVNVSVNIGSQPQWGPRGYDYVDYYYLPDIQSYYYVPTRQFVYRSGNRWIHAKRLPSRYRNYDLYNGRAIVINSPRPWVNHNTYRTRYVNNYYTVRPNRVVYTERHDRNYNQRYRNNGRGIGSDYRKYEKKNKGHKDHGRGRDHGRGHRDRH